MEHANDPIVFAHFDRRPDHEALSLKYRPDRSTTKGELNFTIFANELDNEAPQEIEEFAQFARDAVAQRAAREKNRPIEFLNVEQDGPAT